ncbi:hypothetical protein J3R83DRAFT_13302 [Lanmaoa asiatica]|nr:hypothetical protein J3R83DRAFT_13302 [Lanmaoa asiatica]
MSSSIAIISTLLSLGAAWFYLSPGRRQGQGSTIRFVMTAAVGLHTLLVLSSFALHRPPNLFVRLGIPINSPVDRIRSLLMKEAGFNTIMGERGAVIVPPEIAKDVDTLLTRLAVHGSRDTYVRYERPYPPINAELTRSRFGQRAMQTCWYCSSVADYTILVLSGILLDYLRTATLLLLLTTNINGRQRWRTNVLGALTCAFLAEVYAFTSASAVPLEKDANTAFMRLWVLTMNYDQRSGTTICSWLATCFSWCFPSSSRSCPPSTPPPASVALSQALGRLERTLPRAHLLKYFRQAVLRHPYTRERAVEFWANDAAEGAAARSNPNVQMTASKLGFGFATPTGSGDKGGQDSVLRANARMAVQSLKPLFMPPPH